MERGKIDVLLDGLKLPECPRWRTDRLWFSDMFDQSVMTVDLDGRAQTIADFDTRPSGLGFLTDGSPIAVLYSKQLLVKLGNAAPEQYCDLSILGGHHLNDMIIDNHGRAYVGLRMAPPSLEPANLVKDAIDAIALVDPQGVCSVVARSLISPNGLALSGDGRTLVVGETRAARLTWFAVAADGRLDHLRSLPLLWGAPDGICMDEEDCVWVATLGANRFDRVAGDGRVVESVEIGEDRLAIACTLGGSDRRTLFMMIRKGAITPADLKAGKNEGSRNGSIEMIRVDVPGAGFP